PRAPPPFPTRRSSDLRRLASGSAACWISRRKITLTAPSEPMTAISALGQAKDASARRCLEFMTTYAPPYALRVITVILGTVASRSEEHTSELQSRGHL